MICGILDHRYVTRISYKVQIKTCIIKWIAAARKSDWISYIQRGPSGSTFAPARLYVTVILQWLKKGSILTVVKSLQCKFSCDLMLCVFVCFFAVFSNIHF